MKLTTEFKEKMTELEKAQIAINIHEAIKNQINVVNTLTNLTAARGDIVGDLESIRRSIRFLAEHLAD